MWRNKVASKSPYRAIFLLIFPTILLMGCASGGGRFESSINADNVKDINKLFVFTRANDRYFNPATYSGFESSLKNGLATCEIDAYIFRYDAGELDFEDNFKSKVTGYGPDAILTINQDGGDLTIDGSYGGVSGDLYFNLKLHDWIPEKEIYDLKQEAVIWRSRMVYRLLINNPFVDDEKSGLKLGRELYNQLVADGSLVGCAQLSKDEG